MLIKKKTKIQHLKNLCVVSIFKARGFHRPREGDVFFHTPYKVLPLLVPSTFDHQCYKFLLSLQPTS